MDTFLTGSTPWLLLIVLSLGTYCYRFAFMPFTRQTQENGLFFRILRPIPAAVLAALMTPGLLIPGGAHGQFSLQGLLPALIALAVAWRFGNTLLTIACGLIALWTLNTISPICFVF